MKKLFVIASLFALLFTLAAFTNIHAADATITFTDNANNEQGFRIERNLNGGAFAPLATLGADITMMVDTTLVQSTTADNKYCYRVMAFNTAGDSPYAMTQTQGVTDCKIIPRLVTIPSGPSGLLVQ